MTRSEAIHTVIDIIVYLEAHFAKSQKAKKEAEEIIKALEQINEEEPVNKLTQQAYEDGKKDGYLQAKVDQALNTSWIPVSKRLPDNGEYVLVCYEDGHIRTAYYYIDTNIYPSEFEDCCETGWYNYNEDFMYKQDVIAWMPLPDVYKIEGNEE